MARMIQVEIVRPPWRTRVRRWLTIRWLKLTFRAMTRDEWYAAGCPDIPRKRGLWL